MQHLKRQVFKPKPISEEVKRERVVQKTQIQRTPFSLFTRELGPDNVIGQWLVPVSGELVDITMFADIEEKAEVSISAVGVGKDVTLAVKLKNGKNYLGSQIPVDQGDVITVTLLEITGKGQNAPVLHSMGIVFTLEFT